jgi:hypothetical protein
VLKPVDLQLWRKSNIPVIIVLWRQSDGSTYWKDVTDSKAGDERRLKFDKQADRFGASCADSLAALTVDRKTPGVFVPPMNRGEDAIINMMRIQLPDEIFVCTSPFATGRDAIPELTKHGQSRFDWVIRKRRFLSFFDPREFTTKYIVDEDQVEAVDTGLIGLNDDIDDQNAFIELLRRTTERQLLSELSFLRRDKLFHFHAKAENSSRSYRYVSSVNDASAKVVSYYANKKKPENPGFVRHHAANLRFERLGDEWFVIIDPTFYFTRNGFQPHRYPEALLAGKKRLERNAAVRGQVIMWQHLLASGGAQEADLFNRSDSGPRVGFERLPGISLSLGVPETSWTRTDPRAKDMESGDLFEEGAIG